MSVLTHLEIERFVNESGLIENFSRGSLEGASYDMRLGSRCVMRGSVLVLENQRLTVQLQPGEFILLSTYEELNMPLNLVGHNGIMSPWAKKGLVSLFSPQIDPGFQGPLHVPVFNAGDAAIPLTYLEKMFTVEFVRTSTPASFSWSERHGRQGGLTPPAGAPGEYRPNLTDLAEAKKRLDRVEGSLDGAAKRVDQLTNDVDALRDRVKLLIDHKSISIGKFTLYATMAAIIIAVVLFIISVILDYVEVSDLWERPDQASEIDERSDVN